MDIHIQKMNFDSYLPPPYENVNSKYIRDLPKSKIETIKCLEDNFEENVCSCIR